MDSDTTQHSLQHWSEAGRAGMEAFYTLAIEDYRRLAKARDWAADLHAHSRDGTVRLLDVACGSGKFPAALLDAGLADRCTETVQVDLLDPSEFSLAEARAVLAAPFTPATEHRATLQELDAAHGDYDVAWATHALYAVPPGELRTAVVRMVAALRPGGFGVVAHSAARSHYIAFYDAYRRSHAPTATPFSTAEQVVAALTEAGATVSVKVLHYRTGSADRSVIEGFLQRCAFDDSLSLQQLEATGPLAQYLDASRSRGAYLFMHEVHLITWENAG